MYPPAPGRVSGASTTHDVRTQATAASTALPPARRTSAPASAVSGWPAATTPLMPAMLCASAGQRGVLVHARVRPPDHVVLERQRRRRDLAGAARVEDPALARRGEAHHLEVGRAVGAEEHGRLPLGVHERAPGVGLAAGRAVLVEAAL